MSRLQKNFPVIALTHRKRTAAVGLYLKDRPVILQIPPAFRLIFRLMPDNAKSLFGINKRKGLIYLPFFSIVHKEVPLIIGQNVRVTIAAPRIEAALQTRIVDTCPYCCFRIYKVLRSHHISCFCRNKETFFWGFNLPRQLWAALR